ncbi:cyclic nucleotide-binding domain-containing protein [Sphingosinicella sp. YJ22]|uniref:cyclic nucleotide-binding domain-containing protein n=1 Tax=Sphingosinicella sp. YJ22 TaxID=1104780 RepID=UPI00140DFC73|nr:cyclic nucleotide-binding domain-containing protein [Sphingosinicella sp. YJ22]
MSEQKVRIAIVGSGPAGLSAAARAKQLGISHLLIEKSDHLSDTIYKYQKGKHVMATPVQLPRRSDMKFDAGKREAVLGLWDDLAAEFAIDALINAEVLSITGQDGDFVLKVKGAANRWQRPDKPGEPHGPNVAGAGSDQVQEIRAEKVILAIGTQGNPNRMRVPGGDLPHVQYQLDDPNAYDNEHITVVGAGDAGIENALGLLEDPKLDNVVTILNRTADFSRAKGPNVQAMFAARDEGRLTVMPETTPALVENGWLTVETRDGPQRFRCDRIIARMGSAPPRAFVEGCCATFIEQEDPDGGKPKKVIKPGTGIEFSSPDREAYPKLSPQFESTVPGIFVVGALAGYPLIKHCMNQGYDVVEFINGNTSLEPVDTPLLAAKFSALPGRRSVDEWLEFLRENVIILNGVSPLQMREFMLDSDVRFYRAGDTVFERNEPGSSLFAIASGSVLVEVDPRDRSITVPIETGSIFGEVGLISGRPRGATVRAAEDAIIVEVSRLSALKLMAAVPAAKEAVTRISVERQLLQIFKSGLTSADLADVLDDYKIVRVRAGEAIINEGEEGYDVFVIRVGSMVVERTVAGRPVFLSYLPAGSYVGEMALLDGGRRTATVRAAIKSEVIRLNGDKMRALLARNARLRERFETDMANRQRLNSFIEAKKESFSGAVDLYSSVATFLVEQGIGDATDVLLIDEKLCVGCDNCEKACADSHDGLSRLNREAGKTYAHLHVPTSCRHCEHPHCMADCPPNAIHRGPDGEVFIDDSCIGCGNCQRNCPYGVIRMEMVPPKKPNLLSWLFFGRGPGPGEPSQKWAKANLPLTGDEKKDAELTKKRAIKCDMCSGIPGGPACVRACPTGAAIRVKPEEFLTVARLEA